MVFNGGFDYNFWMNTEVLTVNADEALRLLKQSVILQTGYPRCLFQMKNGTIKVSSARFFLSLSRSDFLDLYSGCQFAVYDQASDQIDLQKDEEYYAWRERSQ